MVGMDTFAASAICSFVAGFGVKVAPGAPFSARLAQDSCLGRCGFAHALMLTSASARCDAVMWRRVPFIECHPSVALRLLAVAREHPEALEAA